MFFQTIADQIGQLIEQIILTDLFNVLCGIVGC